jgi:hypothetical protein
MTANIGCIVRVTRERDGAVFYDLEFSDRDPVRVRGPEHLDGQPFEAGNLISVELHDEPDVPPAARMAK